MDEKQHAKQTKQFKQENERYRLELRNRDQAAHSENKTWKYDYKIGSLVNDKGR